MSKIKNGGLDEYAAGPFKQQHFGTAGVKGVNRVIDRCDIVKNYSAAAVCLWTLVSTVCASCRLSGPPDFRGGSQF